jgi:hypothetical protein
VSVNTIVVATPTNVFYVVTAMTKGNRMTTEQFRQWLKRRAGADGLAALARKHDVLPALLQMVAKGSREPSDAFLAKFGMERADQIRKIKEAKTP